MEREVNVKALVSAVFMMLLAGCYTWPSGQDPAGRDQVAASNRVMAAITDYHQRTGHFPESLEALVPVYISAIPVVEDLWYQKQDGNLSMAYLPSWPQMGRVSCEGWPPMRTLECKTYM